MRNLGEDGAVSILKSEEKIIPWKVSVESGRGGNMGNGVCSRKQKKIFQSLLLVTVVFGMIYGGMFSYEMHKQLKRTEEMAVKYQQHQESLSAQLQVVYEHRSRLEKSLQKERLEHKKSKDDYLGYKIEAQQSLNQEKQDSSVRFNSLHSQHQILKNQHDELKKQYYELQEQHQLQEDEHNKALDEHKQRLDQLHQTKESEISKIKENILNLREENKQLRKAHQEVYVHLQDTRVQVDEYKQLKETLNKMPSLRHKSAQLVQPVQNRNAEEPHQPQDAQPEAEKHDEVQKPQSQHREEDGELGGAEERRRELAEEEMEQAGLPQKLEEEFDVAHIEAEEEEPQANQPDENALEREQHHGHEVAPAEARVQHTQVERVKSAYEQQQEQQRLAAQLAEERRQLHLRQEALQKQQLQQQKEREERLRLQRERVEQHNREADLKEQQLQQEMLRKKAQYENMDADIVQGEEEPQIAEEKEVNVHHEEARQEEADHVHHEDERPVEAEVDPEDDPNNQGEDEFEEAEQHRPHEEEDEEEVAPVGHPDMHLAVEKQHQPPAEEQLVMAGNPDQQEDALDEQYQEDGDDEAQDELVDNQKREAVREEEGDPYNEENGEQEEARDQDVAVKQDNQPAQHPNEENYEEEEEEEEEDNNGDKPPNRRAEM
ncbi:Golgi integral membrane protein 4-like isoform X2 [Sinocyclocheilus anshuiensis]|uniref:Golgi integral membrane protein 4-like isoform X2 n=1 Tax=Sinocyclocheilus anshuiensis TaxID=1608454 RepID=UPI0007B8191F|nr:PREDICTED: Golgi integral membrane protein 4-like isoform X2 [Sinocyclocheilus anshuiensis]